MALDVVCGGRFDRNSGGYGAGPAARSISVRVVPFSQRRQMLEYKAALHQARTVAVDPRYTSQTCPKCGHVARGNRDKRRHRFECHQCHYRSNDDRIGAMNLHRQGIEYRVTGVIAARPRS